MTHRFGGRTAIVTGASRGIGLAVAQRLVDDGARVVITARKQEVPDAAVGTLGTPARALGVAGRADDTDRQADAVTRAIAMFDSVDLLVNDTGITPTYGPMIGMDLDVARTIVEVDCIAALAWIQTAHQARCAEHGGAVVTVSSVAGGFTPTGGA